MHSVWRKRVTNFLFHQDHWDRQFSFAWQIVRCPSICPTVYCGERVRFIRQNLFNHRHNLEIPELSNSLAGEPSSIVKAQHQYEAYHKRPYAIPVGPSAITSATTTRISTSCGFYPHQTSFLCLPSRWMDAWACTLPAERTSFLYLACLWMDAFARAVPAD